MHSLLAKVDNLSMASLEDSSRSLAVTISVGFIC